MANLSGEEGQAFVGEHTKQQRNLLKETTLQTNPQLPGAAVSTYFYKAVTKYFPDRTENNLPNFACVSLERARGGYQKNHSMVSNLSSS